MNCVAAPAVLCFLEFAGGTGGGVDILDEDPLAVDLSARGEGEGGVVGVAEEPSALGARSWSRIDIGP